MATDPIESPEAFAARCFCEEGYPAREVEHCSLGHIIIRNIRARDAAVRREALREAADWLARCVPDEATERNEWQQVLADAADSLCAIADGAPKSPADVTIPTLATGDADD